MAAIGLGAARWASDVAPISFGDVHVLVRGYVAERAALRAALRLDAPSDAQSDAALVALAYRRWGLDLARYVAGEYALALWDEGRSRLLLAHDELGLMPLFYTLEPDAITFASHLDDLVVETGVGDLDDDYIADHLATGEHFGTRTPYRHIRRLAPGERLVWQRGARTTHDVWTLGSIDVQHGRSEGELAEELRDRIVAAVDDAAPRHGSLWCEVSGGLDSSSVFAVARGVLGLQSDALSFVFPQSASADERPWIRAVLRAYPAPWRTIDADSAQPFTEWAVAFHAEPTRWLINAGWNRLYAELVSAHDVDVVLTGEGGDAVLFGDEQSPCHLADELLQLRWRTLWRDAADHARGSPFARSATHVLLKYALVPASRRLRGAPIEMRPAKVPWAAVDFARDAHGRVRTPWLPRAGSVADAYMLQRVARSASLVSTLFASRHWATEVRSPLLSRALVAFMLSLPNAQRMRPNQTRVAHRRAMRGILPDVTLERWDKGGSSQPMCEGLATSEFAVAALTDAPRVVQRGYTGVEAWRDTVEQARCGRLVQLNTFEAWAALELWLQRLEKMPSSGTRKLRTGSRAELSNARPTVAGTP